MTLPEMTCGYPLPFHRSRTDANLPFLPRRVGLQHNNMVVPYQNPAARDAHTSESEGEGCSRRAEGGRRG